MTANANEKKGNEPVGAQRLSWLMQQATSEQRPFTDSEVFNFGIRPEGPNLPKQCVGLHPVPEEYSKVGEIWRAPNGTLAYTCELEGKPGLMVEERFYRYHRELDRTSIVGFIGNQPVWYDRYQMMMSDLDLADEADCLNGRDFGLKLVRNDTPAISLKEASVDLVPRGNIEDALMTQAGQLFYVRGKRRMNHRHRCAGDFEIYLLDTTGAGRLLATQATDEGDITLREVAGTVCVGFRMMSDYTHTYNEILHDLSGHEISEDVHDVVDVIDDNGTPCFVVYYEGQERKGKLRLQLPRQHLSEQRFVDMRGTPYLNRGRFFGERFAYVGRGRHQQECWWLQDAPPQPPFLAVSDLYEENGSWYYWGSTGTHLCQMKLPL